MTDEQFLSTFVDAIDNLSPGDVTCETRLKDIRAWDSLALLNLLSCLEVDYGIELSGQEIADCVTIGDVAQKARAKLASQQ